MLAILRTIILVTGGAILISALVILLIAAAFLGLSSLGLFSFARRNRNK